MYFLIIIPKFFSLRSLNTKRFSNDQPRGTIVETIDDEGGVSLKIPLVL